MNKTIDEIIELYKYTIDITDPNKTANRINDFFYVELKASLRKHCFNDKIKKLNEMLDRAKNKIDNNTLQSYIKEVKTIEDTIKQIVDKQHEDYFSNSIILFRLARECEDNTDNSEIMDIYNKIGKDILDKESKKYIKIEKQFVDFNDRLIDIKNKIENN